MIIPFWPTTDDFFLKDCIIAGDDCVLITPRIGAHWDRSNLIFRSSVWTKRGELISPSFKKFFNWEEQPDLTPKVDFSGYNSFIEKIDGSTLIVSRYKGQLITRTRGTVDAKQMDNGDEIDYLIKKYPLAFNPLDNISLIYEWVSPANQIVVKYNEPDIYLIAMIEHVHYSYCSQQLLDNVAKTMDVKRPQRFGFTSPEHLFQIVTGFEDKEGVCVYFNGDQDIRKVKSSRYLALHALKNMVNSDKAIVDLYIEYNFPNFNDFMAELTRQYDYEIANFIMPSISRICDAYKEYSKMLDHMKEFINEKIRHLPIRRDQAIAINAAYGNSGKSGLAFNLLDNKQVENRKVKQLLLQFMNQI